MHDPSDAASPPAGAPARRVWAEVFGCQMNKLDAQISLEAFLRAGYRPASSADEADVVVFFTCAVRQHAEDRVFSRLGKYARAKRARPDLAVVFAGCVAEEHGAQLLARFPFLDVVCGTRHFPSLPDLVASARAGGPVTAVGEGPAVYDRRSHLDPRPAAAYVSVMRGCSMACAYCIVPAVRGREASRPPEEIRAEVEALAAQGVKDITLLGQTVNAYGRSLGGGVSLAELLWRLAPLKGLRRLRFVTSHPRFMDEALIDAMARIPQVCEGLHLPAQSGSDRVLARMARGYTRDRYLATLAACRERVPGFAPAGDFIVGFPGETDEDFALTEDLVRQARYQNIFVFKYSPRPGTRAAAYEDTVPTEIKEARNLRLLELQREISLELNRGRIGTEVEVLVDGPSTRNARMLAGRTRTGSITIFPPPAQRGAIVRVRVNDATALALYGVVTEEGENGGR